MKKVLIVFYTFLFCTALTFNMLNQLKKDFSIKNKALYKEIRVFNKDKKTDNTTVKHKKSIDSLTTQGKIRPEMLKLIEHIRKKDSIKAK